MLLEKATTVAGFRYIDYTSIMLKSKLEQNYKPFLRIRNVAFLVSILGLWSCSDISETAFHPSKSEIPPSGSASMKEIERHEQTHPATKPIQLREVPILPIPEHDMGSLPATVKTKN